MSNYNDSPAIANAAHTIAQGGVIAYPTEAVWGLGCDPFNEDAVLKILGLKQRDPAKGLILVASSMAQFSPLLTDISAEQRAKLNWSWPGPYTWLVPHKDLIPPWVTGDFSTVALRVSAHPIIQALCRKTGPIVSTSANPQGKLPARFGWQVRRYFARDNRLAYITPGNVGKQAQPTEIRDLQSDQLIRGGG